MGSDRTTSGAMFGIGIPYEVTSVTTTTTGEIEPGTFARSGSSSAVFEAAVTDGETYGGSDIEVRVTRAGAPGPGGAAVAYRADAGSWFGRDAPVCFTGFQGIDTISTTDNPGQVSCVTLDAGVVMVAWVDVATDSAKWSIRDATTGAWSAPDEIDDTTGKAIGLWVGLDGAVYACFSQTTPLAPSGTDAYAIWRTPDLGATWTRQTEVCGIDVNTTQDAALVAARIGGAVAVWRTRFDGANFLATQWASPDGIRFRQVVATRTDEAVWSAHEFGGAIHAIVSVDEGATENAYYYRVGSPFDSLWAGDGVLISEIRDLSDPALLTTDDDGVMYAHYRGGAGAQWDGRRSTDSGSTWSDAFLVENDTTFPQFAAIASVRGAKFIPSMYDVGSTLYVGVLMLAGHTNATVSGQQGDEAHSWVPTADLSGAGRWSTASDVGVPTRTRALNTGERVQTGGGVTAVYNNGPVITSTDGAVFFGSARIAAGSIQWDALTDGAAVRVEVTSTQIRFYDVAGAAPAYANHGGTSADYIEWRVVIDATAHTAKLAYRVRDYNTEREYTDGTSLSGITDPALGEIKLEIAIPASSDVYIGPLHFMDSPVPTAADGWSRPSELDPVPMSTQPVYLTDGVSVRMASGYATIDGVQHTMEPTSPYRAENMAANFLPKPLVGWRSSGLVSNETVTILHPRDFPVLAGMLLDGLVGIHDVTITMGGAPTAVDLSVPIRYTGSAGGVVIPSRTGANTSLPWVRADELKGWAFEDSAGVVFRVAGNSEGSLTYGATVAEHRAVIYIDDPDLDATGGTNLSGVLYPSRALVVSHLGAGDVMLGEQISIVAANQHTPPEGYRAIGLALPMRVHLCGVGPDLSEAHVQDDDGMIQTMPDGQRFSGRRSADGRRVELSWSLSPRLTSQQRAAASSPDYVRHLTSGGDPAASADGVPFVLQGVTARARALGRGGLVCALHAIPRRASTGLYATVWGLQDLVTYGRLVGPVRIEGVQYIGAPRSTQVYRVASVTIEEER